MSLFLSRTARKKHGLGSAFGVSGRVGLPTFYQARVLAMELGAQLGEIVKGVTAGRLNALSELERLFREIAMELVSVEDVAGLRVFLSVLIDRFGAEPIDRLLTEFSREFMPFELPAGWTERLDDAEGDTVIQQAAEVLRELLVFGWVSRVPEADGVQEWLHESEVASDPLFEPLFDALETWVDPETAERAESSVARLEKLQKAPDLPTQLATARELWPAREEIVGSGLVAALDLIQEEERPRFEPGGTPPPIELPAYSHLEDEPAHFTPDEPWMASVGILAKNTFVWLDQLSRRHGRSVRRLDEIPEIEFEEMAELGVNTLWLVGVWERSPASKAVKKLCGNESAVASAYSLRAYRIAEALGGERALSLLEWRAEKYGIRLAADMVPNHLGIDSDWIYDHSERFLSLPVPPYPSYTFEGPNLSDREGIEVRLEDHYFDRSDAAVVFQRKETETGDTRYIYHGNDGTTTPWNDTAQLNYLSAAVREAVIEEILEVAALFPVLRFDAAMTLAKKHVQRLWFPLPGEAGAIPSRAEHALTQEAFDLAMPEEFWREVVARVVSERPGTMILAEAFWLMESYFARSLGVHRVYNSAFMNLLRDGKDRKYRNLLKETVRFDVRILQRYVNFMTNPDEQTAVEQFGSADRYFGVCTLLATLPGTPLFGHGQFQGLREKYGMEFSRPLVDEEVSQETVEGHRRRIAPLLEDRGLFAGAENFRLYDFIGPDGTAVESVYAYSNQAQGRAALVVFNHSSEPVVGRIHESVPSRARDRGEAKSALLVRALGLNSAPGDYWLFHDAVEDRAWLRSTKALRSHGIEIRLRPFESRVLVEFRNVGEDRSGLYRELAQGAGRWGGRDVEARVLALRAEPAARQLRALLGRARLKALLSPKTSSAAESPEVWGRDLDQLRSLLFEVGFLSSAARQERVETGAELIKRLGEVSRSFVELPWPATDRMKRGRDRWIAGLSQERHLLLTGQAILGAISQWGSGARMFIDTVQAELAIEALLPSVPRGDPRLDLYRERFDVRPGLPPDGAQLGELSEALPVVPGERRAFVWWQLASVATTWGKPVDESRGSYRLPRKLTRERPEDVVVGWTDALERLLED